ncbi:alpha/beta-hydrolase [Plenodomus tracheiphilus IPT5]|uniref:Alpha/beta-hydrolase n=1 Tax=Plenodomus tracheiphilus IPT5 TaxID=1408161 RepID=A0A6A7AVG2_9PLEO|nr:alpha/beta-hydrolase [Plenodomus tracheiphilus IPT5]
MADPPPSLTTPKTPNQQPLETPQPLPPRPPIDPALAPILSAYPIPDELNLNLMRGMNIVPEGEPNPFHYTAETVLSAHPNYTHQEHTIPGIDNNAIIISVFTPTTPTPTSENEKNGKEEALQQPQPQPRLHPTLYHIHGGAQISGSRFSGVSETLSLCPSPTILLTIEYRLAPETRAPGGAEDCFSGLVWLFAHASALGIDASRVVVYGVSGGGALAAVVALMARDRGVGVGVGGEGEGDVEGQGELGGRGRIKGVMLHTPMLDDRCDSVSDNQFWRQSPWSGLANSQAWDLVLGNGVRGSRGVTPYQAPARETVYEGLPPMYVDVAECEVFRDTAVRWAGELWRAGGTCELHVWPGVWHIFDMMEGRDVPVVNMSVAAKKNWLGRMMKAEEM